MLYGSRRLLQVALVCGDTVANAVEERPPPALVRNAYLEEAAARGAAPLLAVVLAYGRTGEVPVAEIEAICERVGLRPVGKSLEPRQA